MPKIHSLLKLFAILLTVIGCAESHEKEKPAHLSGPETQQLPNILFVISDDQSFPHASAYGSTWINTPAFDRVAREGVLFINAFSASPGCSPSRAAILTGMNTWQLEDAGTHASAFPSKFQVYPDILEAAGYHVGYTQKGWGPGNWKVSGRPRNPAGNIYNQKKLEPPTTGIAANDYAANFEDFLAQRPKEKPFYFWFGASEPHRVFEKGSGLKAGKNPDEVEVPAFLPDTEEIRHDLLDYALEIEWYDKHLGQMMGLLEKAGELDNTIIVVTSDNGMAFPRAKANLYEFGQHVPLAIRWGDKVPGGRVVEDLVSLIDLFPTYMQATGLEISQSQNPLEGKSLMDILLSDKEGIVDSTRQGVFSARERHSSSRWQNLSYPQRSLRTDRFLYIVNFAPERWPAGAPQKIEKDGTLGRMHGAYHDIDACPTHDFLVENREDPQVSRYFNLAVEKRPGEEFFDIQKDPACLNNLADDPEFKEELKAHRKQLGGYLMETRDPRVTGRGEIYESYIRYSPLREFPVPDWAEENELQSGK